MRSNKVQSLGLKVGSRVKVNIPKDCRDPAEPATIEGRILDFFTYSYENDSCNVECDDGNVHGCAVSWIKCKA